MTSCANRSTLAGIYVGEPENKMPREENRHPDRFQTIVLVQTVLLTY